MYALLLMIPTGIIIGIAAMSCLEKTDIDPNLKYAAIIAVSLPLYFICLKIGKKIFDFTEKRLLRVCKTCERAESLATFIECGVFFAVIGLFLGGTLLIEHIRDRAADTAQELNGWDG